MKNSRTMHVTGRALLRASAGSFALMCALSADAAVAQVIEGTAPAAEAEAAEVDAASTNAEAQAAGDSAAQDIVVTASRAGRAGFEAPTPTTVLDAVDLQKTGVTNPADLLNRSPVFAASTTPASTGSSTINVPGANFLNLRGLGTTRTLVLVDGRRHVPTSVTGTIDVNLIPSLLISKVDVVTGGASAAWGSDAVSGVVNFILDKKLDGLRANLQAGVSDYGDDGQFLVQGAYGKIFLDDRLRVIVSGEYFKNNGAGLQGSRKWGNDGWNLVSNPAYTGAAGQFQRIVTPGVGYSNATSGGMITNRTGPLAGIQFGPGGTVEPFTYGTSVGSSFMVGGSGQNLDLLASLSPRQDRWSTYGHIGFNVTPDITASVDVSVARSHAVSITTPATDYGNITIRRDNAYLPDSVRTIMVANNIQSFRMGRLNDQDLGFIRTDNTTKIQRYVASLEGKFGNGWNWGAYYEHGISDYRQVYLDNRNQARWSMGIDAVVNPANGQIVCRSTLTNSGNGCVPINVFGVGSISQAAKDYVLADPYSTTRIKEDAAGVNLAGEPFELWAGPVSIAVGAEYRKQSLNTVSDALSQAGAYRIGNPRATSGSYNVKEAFGELVVPLAKDLPMLQSLDFNGAVRHTDYSLSGQVTSWKLGGTWEPISGIRFRAARSHDIRAPNLNELFLAERQVSGVTVLDPVTRVQFPVFQINTGNRDLRPEVGNTWTYGVVFDPAFAPGLRASIDIADIKLNNAISTLLPQDTVDRCANGSTALCGLIARDGQGVITSVTTPFLNLASIRSRSLDGELSYRMPIGSGDAALDFRVLGTYLLKFETADGVTTLHQAGTAERPRYRQTTRITYSSGPFRFFAEDIFISKSRAFAQYSGNQISDNSVPSRNYVNLSASIGVKDTGVELFGAVTNVFDKAPPIVVSGSVYALETNAATYDTIGRRFMIGVRIR